MGYLVEGLELFIRKVAYTTNDATSLVRWSNYTICTACFNIQTLAFYLECWFHGTASVVERSVSGYRSRGPGFDSRRFRLSEAVDLERGPLSLVRTTEELLGRKSSGVGLENRD
jgi:hypothetical protein